MLATPRRIHHSSITHSTQPPQQKQYLREGTWRGAASQQPSHGWARVAEPVGQNLQVTLCWGVSAFKCRIHHCSGFSMFFLIFKLVYPSNFWSNYGNLYFTITGSSAIQYCLIVTVPERATGIQPLHD